MSIPVLICDDSSFARKQMARSIPDEWDVNIEFAGNGQEAIEQIRLGKGDVMFLDLNMPVMDGYETMELIRKEDLPCLVIVVSGDVQPKAREKMLALGALDFIKKPIDNAKLVKLLREYGIYSGESSAAQREKAITPLASKSQDESFDAYRELVNVAMGQAGAGLAKQLNKFIELPIPKVNFIASTELQMAITELNEKETVSAVSKGFISSGINGEALVIFSDAKVVSMAELLNYKSADTEAQQVEVLMDISNIVIGACLHALSEQLHVQFSHSSPIILGQHCDLGTLVHNNISHSLKLMAIEITYAIQDHDISFDLLLLFPESSMDVIYSRLTNIEDYVA